MPEESHSERKLHLPPTEPDPTGKPQNVGPGSAGGSAKGGFLSAMAFKPQQRKTPDLARPPVAGGAPGEVPLPPDPTAGWEPEGWESAPPDPETLTIPAPSRGRHVMGSLMEMGQASVRVDHAIFALCVLVCITAIFSSVTAWKLGADAGEKRLIEKQTKTDVMFSAEYFARLNKAFEDLRAGKSGEALKTFQALEAQNPDVSPMAYLIALTAMRSGDMDLAEEKAALSIRKREKVSDSIALQALIQAQKSGDPNTKKFGDNMLRAELALKQAMLADISNPLPMIELSALLREQGKTDEALEFLRAARSRVQPVDLIPFVDTTSSLAVLQASPDGALTEPANPDKDLTSAFSAAYIAMRKGHFDQAAKILNSTRSRTDPALFRYLINDRAIRSYSREPQLREFFY